MHQLTNSVTAKPQQAYSQVCIYRKFHEGSGELPSADTTVMIDEITLEVVSNSTILFSDLTKEQRYMGQSILIIKKSYNEFKK